MSGPKTVESALKLYTAQENNQRIRTKNAELRTLLTLQKSTRGASHLRTWNHVRSQHIRKAFNWPIFTHTHTNKTHMHANTVTGEGLQWLRRALSITRNTTRSITQTEQDTAHIQSEVVHEREARRKQTFSERQARTRNGHSSQVSRTNEQRKVTHKFIQELLRGADNTSLSNSTEYEPYPS